MLGKTHMATGLLASIVTLSMVDAVHPRAWLVQASHGNFLNLETAALWIGLGVVGSILPDLDEFHSIGTRKVEAIVRTILMLFFLLLTVQHGGFNTLSLIVLVAAVLTLMGGEMARKISMLMIAMGCIVLAIIDAKYGTSFLTGMMLMAVWSTITAFVAHRTFTHSLFGLLVLGIGLGMALTPLHLLLLTYAVVIGYIVHMLADTVSGGVPVLWPLAVGEHKRLGVRLVKTGSTIDHTVGLASLIATVVLAAGYWQ